DACGRAGRGGGDDRGRLRALPAPARLSPANVARPDRHRARPRARRRRSRGELTLLGAGRVPADLHTVSVPSSTASDLAASVGATDIVVLRRVTGQRFVHLGGAGRGEGWAGIVEV